MKAYSDWGVDHFNLFCEWGIHETIQVPDRNLHASMLWSASID